MAVRRLAVDSVQPAHFAFSPENEAWAKDQLAKYPPGRQASAVIPLLWRAQEQNAYWLPKPAIEKVADMLGMAYIRALEIATFYSMFNLEPVGHHLIQMCGTTPCVLRGSDEIRALLRSRIGDEHHVSADGKFSWIEVECLGACCNAPMVQINNDYYEDLTVENFTTLLDDLAAGRPVKVGSQVGRTTSEFEAGKATTLTDAALYDGSVVGAWRKRFDEEADRAAAKVPADHGTATAEEPAKPTPQGKSAEPPKPAEKPAEPPKSEEQDKPAEPAKLAVVGEAVPSAQSVEPGTSLDPAAAGKSVEASGPGSGKLAEPAAAAIVPTASAQHHAIDSKAAADAAQAQTPPATDHSRAETPATGRVEASALGGDAAPSAPFAHHAIDSGAAAAAALDDAAAPQASSPAVSDDALERVDIDAEGRADAAGQRPAADDQAQPGARDDLRQIVGIGTANQKRLHALGVYRYAQIAAWSPENAAWMSAYVGFPGRVEREEWIAQAQDLAAGRLPRAVTTQVQPNPVPPPLGGPPASAPVAQVLAQSADEEELTEAQRAAEATFVAAKLSMLSPSATPLERADAVGERPKALPRARADVPDDLKRIRGIGPINEGKLHELGIFHFDQIAAWGRPEVNWVGAYLAFPGRIDREAWMRQARALAGNKHIEGA